jgi:predicted regulator of Ras-like GTPase activity (Roadblock/LC7/MglB family)
LKVPFKISSPPSDIKPKLTLVPGSEPAPEKKEEAKIVPVLAGAPNDAVISLGLRVVLHNMPVFQLSGSADSVPTDVRIDLPLSLVESQLASGRIAIPAKQFRDALPAVHRELFVVDNGESPVLLPLQEVLKNLPATVLKMREDQEAADATAAFETPFSIKAAEDAKRFGGPKTQAVEPVAIKTEAQPKEAAPKAAPKIEKTPSPGAGVTGVGETTGDQPKAEAAPVTSAKTVVKAETKVEANTSAKDVVTRASDLPGVAACSITFEDGLSLAGNLPDDVPVGGLCAMAPSVLQKINRHTVDTKLGALRSMTLHCQESQMSFFMKGSVCLTVLHKNGDLASDTQNKLAEMAQELARTYSQPEAAHVHH